jgi:multidrug efflux system membrane fusion protein
MPENDSTAPSKHLGRIVSIAIIAGALITGLLVVSATDRHPRTDDAEVFANYIGIAPQVDGPITQLAVQDNAFIKQGELLFQIDSRPYEYALEKAKSDFNVLEGQIGDQRRTIASQVSAVGAARANTDSAAANVARAAAAVNEAKASVANAQAALERTSAELNYTSNNFHRIEPLLAKQFVTADTVDQARTAVTAGQRAVEQHRSQLLLAQAQVESAEAAYLQTKAAQEQSHSQLNQSQHAVLTIDPFTAQRGGRTSAVQTAEYNLNNCRIYAPFDARVTNLTISQGAYAHTGQQVFTLIDSRVWWAIANFRETQLRHITPGMHADVYVLSRPQIKYDGIVDSIGFGVRPDSTLVGTFASTGLPDVQRSLNWVHLATRFPVRVRIVAPESEPFRLSESAVVIIRGDEKR